MEIKLSPIGYVVSPYKEKGDAPRQGVFASDSFGEIHVLDQFRDGLSDIVPGCRITVLFYFHKESECKIKTTTKHSDKITGIFSTRAPARPNHIGIDDVTVTGIDGCVIHVDGLDMLDGTPILDIKPFMQL